MQALRQAESGTPVVDICRKLGVSEQTFYRWKNKFMGLDVSDVHELKQLRDEDPTLKQLVANLNRDETILTQADATSGAIPSSRAGTTNSIIQERISLGKLISASRLPASDSSERRLVLDASSSTSPPRGSMNGLMTAIRPLQARPRCSFAT